MHEHGVAVRQATIFDLDLLVPLFDAYRQFYRKPSDRGGRGKQISMFTISTPRPFPLAVEIWSRLYTSGDMALLAEFLTFVALSTQALNGTADELLRQAIDALAAEIAPGTPEQTDLVARADITVEAARLSIPTLVIVTNRDPLVSPGLQRELAASIPGAWLAELDSGHLPIVEQPDRWAELVTSFLAEQQDAATTSSNTAEAGR